MPWVTHAGEPRPWRSDKRLAPFGEPGYPDDFMVEFPVKETSNEPVEGMWVTAIAYDPTSDQFLGILINQPDLLHDIAEAENIVFHVSVETKRLVAMRVNGSYADAGWPPTAAPQFLEGLRQGIRAYRDGHDGHNMPEIEHCIAVLSPLMANVPPTARKDEAFVGHFVLGRCNAEKYQTELAIREFRAALALEPADLDSHMALLAELSLMTHKRPGDLSPTDEKRWVRDFIDELTVVRKDFGQNPDVQLILTAIFKSADSKTDSVSAAERDRFRQVGYGIFRWKRR